MRAQAVRDTRHATLTTLQAHVAKQHQSLTDHPRAHAQGAVQKLVARAHTRRSADWVALPFAERPIALPVQSWRLSGTNE